MPIAVAAVVFCIVLFAPPVLNDGDTWAHIAVGRWILLHQAVSWADPFSFSFADRPWIASEWLSELAMAIAHRLGGVTGVLILTAIAAALAAGLLMRHLSIWLDPLPALVVFVFGTTCGAASVLARPHMLALPVLELWTAGLLIARSRNVAPSVWLLPVMVLWANLHGSFAFGLFLIVPLGLEAWLAGPPRAARDWAVFLAAAIVAALVTPYGWHGLIPPFRLLAISHLGNIGEWRSLDLSTPQPLEIALLVVLYVCLSRGVRIPPVRLLLVMGLLHMALQHTRHGMLAGIVGALVRWRSRWPTRSTSGLAARDAPAGGPLPGLAWRPRRCCCGCCTRWCSGTGFRRRSPRWRRFPLSSKHSRYSTTTRSAGC